MTSRYEDEGHHENLHHKPEWFRSVQNAWTIGVSNAFRGGTWMIFASLDVFRCTCSRTNNPGHPNVDQVVQDGPGPLQVPSLLRGHSSLSLFAQVLLYISWLPYAGIG